MNFFLISLSILLFGGKGYSQVSYGVKSGINIATTRDLTAFPSNRVGWYAGGFVTIPLNKNIFLQPELLYSSKGNGNYNQVGPWKITTRLNYINVPIFVGYKIDQKISILFGPELGYRTSAHLVLSNGIRYNESEHYAPNFDIALAIGLNYKILKKFGVDVGYNYGFKTFYYLDESGVRHGNYWAANRVFHLGAFYVLNK